MPICSNSLSRRARVLTAFAFTFLEPATSQELIPFRDSRKRTQLRKSSAPRPSAWLTGHIVRFRQGGASRDATERRGPSLPADYAAPPKVGLLAVTEHGLQLSVEGARQRITVAEQHGSPRRRF